MSMTYEEALKHLRKAFGGYSGIPGLTDSVKDWVEYGKTSTPKPLAPPQCKKTHRLKTEQEMGQENPTLRKYGGQKIGTLTSLGGLLYATIDGSVVAVEHAWVETKVLHTFPNTGGKTSWCSCCGATGRWNWRAGEFEAA